MSAGSSTSGPAARQRPREHHLQCLFQMGQRVQTRKFPAVTVDTAGVMLEGREEAILTLKCPDSAQQTLMVDGMSVWPHALFQLWVTKLPEQ